MRVRSSNGPLVPGPALELALGLALVAAAGTHAQQARAQQEGLHAYELDAGESWLVVVTHRSGLLSFLGHEHAIVPSEWSADLCLAEPVPTGAGGTLDIPTAALVIDSDSARALAGLGGGPDADKVRELQDKMLDAEHLDAQGFPRIRLEARAQQAADGGTTVARVDLTLHGVTRELEAPVAIEADGEGRLLLSGELRIRQRDFGIEPESIAGVVKVADPVVVRFRIAVRR
jgi:hypothetical protein